MNKKIIAGFTQKKPHQYLGIRTKNYQYAEKLWKEITEEKIFDEQDEIKLLLQIIELTGLPDHDKTKRGSDLLQTCFRGRG